MHDRDGFRGREDVARPPPVLDRRFRAAPRGLPPRRRRRRKTRRSPRTEALKAQNHRGARRLRRPQPADHGARVPVADRGAVPLDAVPAREDRGAARRFNGGFAARRALRGQRSRALRAAAALPRRARRALARADARGDAKGVWHLQRRLDPRAGPRRPRRVASRGVGGGLVLLSGPGRAGRGRRRVRRFFSAAARLEPRVVQRLRGPVRGRAGPPRRRVLRGRRARLRARAPLQRPLPPRFPREGPPVLHAPRPPVRRELHGLYARS